MLAGGTGAAQAGGAEFAGCPSEVRGDVSGAYQDYLSNPYYGPDAEAWALGSLAHLEAGYYAQSGAYWPPYTAVTCQTVPGAGVEAGQPPIKFQPEGCPEAWLGLDIPRAGTVPTVEWGTYLPDGFYTLAAADSDPTWTTVCLAPLDLVPVIEQTAPPAAPAPPVVPPAPSPPVAP